MLSLLVKYCQLTSTSLDLVTLMISDYLYLLSYFTQKSLMHRAFQGLWSHPSKIRVLMSGNGRVCWLGFFREAEKCALKRYMSCSPIPDSSYPILSNITREFQHFLCYFSMPSLSLALNSPSSRLRILLVHQIYMLKLNS